MLHNSKTNPVMAIAKNSLMFWEFCERKESRSLVYFIQKAIPSIWADMKKSECVENKGMDGRDKWVISINMGKDTGEDQSRDTGRDREMEMGGRNNHEGRKSVQSK